MYTIKADGLTIYDPLGDETTAISEAVLTEEINKAGSFEFTIDTNNQAYDRIMPLKTNIDIYEDSYRIWSGRIINVERDFYNQKRITCEGLLGFFNDILFVPDEFGWYEPEKEEPDPGTGGETEPDQPVENPQQDPSDYFDTKQIIIGVGETSKTLTINKSEVGIPFIPTFTATYSDTVSYERAKVTLTHGYLGYTENVTSEESTQFFIDNGTTVSGKVVFHPEHLGGFDSWGVTVDRTSGTTQGTITLTLKVPKDISSTDKYFGREFELDVATLPTVSSSHEGDYTFVIDSVPYDCTPIFDLYYCAKSGSVVGPGGERTDFISISDATITYPDDKTMVLGRNVFDDVQWTTTSEAKSVTVHVKGAERAQVTITCYLLNSTTPEPGPDPPDPGPPPLPPEYQGVAFKEVAEKLIEKFNSRQIAGRLITLDLDEALENFYISGDFDKYDSMWNVISTNLFENPKVFAYMTYTSNGATMRIRKTASRLNNGYIEFGTNLLDLTSSIDATQIYTYIYPFGKDGLKLSDAEGVVSDYIYDPELEVLYGRIEHYEDFSDVFLIDELRTKAQDMLDNVMVNATKIEIKAIDLRYISTIRSDKIKVGYEVHVISKPHAIDDYFLCTKIETNLLEPENTQYYLGSLDNYLTDMV